MNKIDEKNEDRLVVEFKVDDAVVKLSPTIVKDYIVSGGGTVSMQEYKFFTEMCKVRKLNPFLKEAYLIKFGSQPAQIVVGKDAILKRAVKNSEFNGKEHGIIVLTKDGDVVERKGSFKLDSDKLVGGWAKVYRKDWEHPTYASVTFNEVAQTKSDGSLNSNWANKGCTMVEKVALVRALRETFIEDLGGMVDENETWSNEDLSRVLHDDEVIIQEEPDVVEAEVKEVNINDL